MPDFQLNITEVALSDIQNAIEWYNEQQSGLGNRFLNALRDAYKTIRRNPELCGFYGKSTFIRRFKLKKFPFYIFLSIATDIIDIVGVIHTARSDKYIRKRIS